MVDQTSPENESPMVFTVVPSAIPAGVRCRPCGRLHLPHRIRRHGGIDDEPVLRCPRCGATGPLLVDQSDPTQIEILRAFAADDGTPAHP